jgi:hypothetical protein
MVGGDGIIALSGGGISGTTISFQDIDKTEIKFVYDMQEKVDLYPNYWLRRALCGSPYLSNLFAEAHEG